MQIVAINMIQSFILKLQIFFLETCVSFAPFDHVSFVFTGTLLLFMMIRYVLYEEHICVQVSDFVFGERS